MLNIAIIVGSTRPGRFSEQVVPWIEAGLKDHSEITYTVLDLRDYPLALFDNPVGPSHVTDGKYGSAPVDAWAEKIAAFDGFIMIAPEYNHGYSAVLKNALDVIYREWNNKPVAFVSYGSVGGGRVVEQLRQVAVELQMAPIRNAVHIQAPWFLRDESGQLKAGALDSYAGARTGMIEQLSWWSKALKTAREVK